MIVHRKKFIEIIYDWIFSATSQKEEWGRWHQKTKDEIARISNLGVLPKEISDPTEIKYYSIIATNILKNVNSDINDVLEVGGGSGALSLALCKKINTRCTILDNSDIALKYASLVFGNRKAQFVKSGADQLPFPDKSFDLVHSVGLIEHYSNQEIEPMIAEISRVLRVGGYFYLAVPNFFSLELLRLWWKYGKGSERYITVRDLKKFVCEYGFNVVEAGHSEFCFSETINKIIPFSLERFLGRHGLGFLNYIICRKT